MEHRGIFMLAVGAAAVAAIVMALQPKPVITRTDAGKAAKAGQATSLPPEAALVPGESVVQPSGDPLMPHYTAPAPPPPAPRVADETAAAPRAPVSTPAKPAAPPAPKPAARAEPRTPSFARNDPHPTSPFDTWPNPAPVLCDTCGQVEALTVWPDMTEVRVRLDGGSLRTVRTPARAPWHVGEHVRFERGRLVRD